MPLTIYPTPTRGGSAGTGGVGPKGDKGDPGTPGAASTVPGPKGDKGDTGDTGSAGAPSTVPGPKGDTGDAGAASTVPGPKGDKGDTGAASTVAGPKGDTGPESWATPVAWSSTTTYTGTAPRSVVTYQGQTYVALKTSTNITPGTDATAWLLIAAKGADGSTGSGSAATTAAGTWQTTAGQTVPSSTWHPLALSSPNAANLGLTLGTSRVTAVTAGWYVATANLSFGSPAGGSRRIGIWVNGVNTLNQGGDETVQTLPFVTTVGVIRLAVGDYVEWRGWQDTGSAQALNGGQVGLALL